MRLVLKYVSCAQTPSDGLVPGPDNFGLVMDEPTIQIFEEAPPATWTVRKLPLTSCGDLAPVGSSSALHTDRALTDVPAGIYLGDVQQSVH